MNTDKIYAQNIANEYAPKNASKVVALKSWTKKQSSLQRFSPIPLESYPRLF